MVENPTHIKDLVPDPNNRRKHTPRNVGMIVDALHKVGTGRSIVIDETNTVLAGNATIEAAGEAGITDLKIVDAKGTEIVAVRRIGLSEAQKRDLAMYDNRTAELAEWDIDQLAKDAEEGLDLSGVFSEAELDTMMSKSKGGAETIHLDQCVQLVPSREYIVVLCSNGEEGAHEFDQLREALAIKTTREGGSEVGSKTDTVGISRVVTAERMLGALHGSRHTE